MGNVLLLVFAVGSLSCWAQSSKKNLTENKGKYYSILLMRVSNETHYEDFYGRFMRILSDQGSYIEREFEVEAPRGNISDLGQPNRALVVYHGSQAKEKNLRSSRDYGETQRVLEAATDYFKTIKGTSVSFQASGSRESQRFYLMKISYFKEDTQGREEMLTEIRPLFDPYGFKTERMIKGLAAEGMNTPDEVSIHFHDEASQAGALMQDSKATQAIGDYNQKYVANYAYLSLRLRP